MFNLVARALLIGYLKVLIDLQHNCYVVASMYLMCSEWFIEHCPLNWCSSMIVNELKEKTESRQFKLMITVRHNNS